MKVKLLKKLRRLARKNIVIKYANNTYYVSRLEEYDGVTCFTTFSPFFCSPKLEEAEKILKESRFNFIYNYVIQRKVEKLNKS